MIEIIAEGLLLDILISSQQPQCRCVCATEYDVANIPQPNFGVIYN